MRKEQILAQLSPFAREEMSGLLCNSQSFWRHIFLLRQLTINIELVLKVALTGGGPPDMQMYALKQWKK